MDKQKLNVSTFADYINYFMDENENVRIMILSNIAHQVIIDIKNQLKKDNYYKYLQLEASRLSYK